MRVAGYMTDTVLVSSDVDVVQLVPGNRYVVTTKSAQFTGVCVGIGTDLKRTTFAAFVPFDGSWTGKQRRVVLSEITQIEKLP